MINMPSEAELLIEWKKRLGLMDWTIELETKCDPEKMDLEDSDGCVSYAEVLKAAKIQIVDPEKRDEEAFYPFDYELVLVHELLHLKLCLLERGDNWEKLQLRLLHMLLNDLAKALVDAKRYKDEECESSDQDGST